MSLSSSKLWPLSVARTTGAEHAGLLQALLATTSLDEISTADDFAAVHNYAKYQGKADDSGKTTRGLVFWVYPTGLQGPFHETKDHQMKQHGVLITVESGVSIEEVVRGARAGLKGNGIFHEHMSA